MKAVLTILGAALLAVVSIFLIFAACIPAKEPARTGITPEQQGGGPDIGRGVPGSSCATDRLGQSFELDGVTYVCSGSKPYRWRAQK